MGEGQARRAAAERIGSQVSATAMNSRLEMRVAVATISQGIQRTLEVGHINDERGAIHAERLFEAQVAGLAAEVAGLQQLERARVPIVVVRAGLHPVGRVDD